MTTTDFHSLLDGGSPEEPRAPAPVSGRELEELLSPLSCEEFIDTYFSRVSLNVEGNPQKFDRIFGWERLKQTLARGKTIQNRRHNITASFTSGEASGSSRPMIAAHHEQVGDLLNAGATICMTNIHMADPFLTQWALEILHGSGQGLARPQCGIPTGTHRTGRDRRRKTAGRDGLSRSGTEPRGFALSPRRRR